MLLWLWLAFAEAPGPGELAAVAVAPVTAVLFAIYLAHGMADGIVQPVGSLAAFAAAYVVPAVLTYVLISRRHFREARRSAGLCLRCGYDLRGNVSGACPECGTPTPARGEA